MNSNKMLHCYHTERSRQGHTQSKKDAPTATTRTVDFLVSSTVGPRALWQSTQS